jgi:hypothetical protein
MCADAPEECEFHLVVPVRHPSGPWSEGEVGAVAQAKLDEGLAAFRRVAPGAKVTGEVGDANPVYATSAALLADPDRDWTGIIVSTLPPGVSRWLGLDAVSRIRREFDLPVTHLVATKEPAEA